VRTYAQSLSVWLTRAIQRIRRRSDSTMASGGRFACPSAAARPWPCSGRISEVVAHGAHAVLLMDPAGWAQFGRSRGDDNITRRPIPLPLARTQPAQECLASSARGHCSGIRTSALDDQLPTWGWPNPGHVLARGTRAAGRPGARPEGNPGAALTRRPGAYIVKWIPHLLP